MRLRVFAIFILSLMAFAMTAIAQEDNTPTVAELELTVTQLFIQETQTAGADSGEPLPTATDDPFVMTATALIFQATQTGQALGSTPVPATPVESIDDFSLTATRIVEEATIIATNQDIQEPDNPQNGADSPLGLTLIAFALLIVVLIIIGGGYLFINSRTGSQK